MVGTHLKDKEKAGKENRFALTENGVDFKAGNCIRLDG
jgi:hypothetical protein